MFDSPVAAIAFAAALVNLWLNLRNRKPHFPSLPPGTPPATMADIPNADLLRMPEMLERAPMDRERRTRLTIVVYEEIESRRRRGRL